MKRMKWKNHCKFSLGINKLENSISLLSVDYLAPITNPLRSRPMNDKKAVLPQGNRAMPQLFFSV